MTPDRLPLTLAFDFPTLRKLTTFLQDAQGQPASSTEPVWRTGAVESLFLHVGVQCITASLADGSHHQQFLQTAVIGCDAAVETPLARWDVNSHGNDTVSVTRHGSFLTEIDLFDAAHFEMSFAEAAVIDPGQRLVLQCAGEVLPHTDARDCSASCAVVVAQFHNDWSLLMGSCSGTSPSSHASAAVCALASFRLRETWSADAVSAQPGRVTLPPIRASALSEVPASQPIGFPSARPPVPGVCIHDQRQSIGGSNETVECAMPRSSTV